MVRFAAALLGLAIGTTSSLAAELRGGAAAFQDEDPISDFEARMLEEEARRLAQGQGPTATDEKNPPPQNTPPENVPPQDPPPHPPPPFGSDCEPGPWVNEDGIELGCDASAANSWANLQAYIDAQIEAAQADESCDSEDESCEIIITLDDYTDAEQCADDPPLTINGVQGANVTLMCNENVTSTADFKSEEGTCTFRQRDGNPNPMLSVMNSDAIAIKNLKFISYDCDTPDSQGLIQVNNTFEVDLDCSQLVNGEGINGGCMQILNASVISVTSSRFYNCRATKDGGGLYIEELVEPDMKTSMFYINNTVFNKCRAGGRGGGAYVDVDAIETEDEVFMQQCISEGDGAGLYLAASDTYCMRLRCNSCQTTGGCGSCVAADDWETITFVSFHTMNALRKVPPSEDPNLAEESPVTEAPLCLKVNGVAQAAVWQDWP